MFGSYLNNNLNQTQSQTPQQNQFLQGNPSVDPNAQTDWMNPSNSTSNSGFSGMGSSGGATPISSASNNGTLLGSIGSGGSQSGVGQYTPEGYNTGKLNDPANANSLKYQVGRILSNYPPGEAGLQQASQQLQALGISVIGKDTIRLPDGTTTDVGRAFSDPNAQHAWQYNWSGPMDGSGQSQSRPTSYMNNTSAHADLVNPTFMRQLLQEMFSGQQAQRKLMADQGPNQQGGFIPPTGGFSGWGNSSTGPAESPIPTLGRQGNFDSYMNPDSQIYFGGGVVDPVTGQRRQPRPGEPQ